MQTEFKYKFVQQGVSAPKKLKQNEFWFDTGNRIGPCVIDHHGTYSEKSACQILMENYQDLILPYLIPEKDVTVVLHKNPDLDAICSAWLFKMLVGNYKEKKTYGLLYKIAGQISNSDQGFLEPEKIEEAWTVIFNLKLSLLPDNTSDLNKIEYGFEVLDKTFDVLSLKRNFTDAAKEITDETIIKEIETAKNDYISDLKNGRIFEFRIPKCNGKTNKDIRENSDALLLINPKSRLFKQLARTDKKNSPSKKGFTLLIVVREIIGIQKKLHRYIISTDPSSGFHLKGLGMMLEKQEQRLENSSEMPLLKGRERLPGNTGRYGYNVNSPWYDGRGHKYTIIDSPAVQMNGKKYFASQLSIKDVIQCLSEYSKNKT